MTGARTVLPERTGAVVVGAGPAGLACSACLSRRDIEHVLFEREDVVAPSWRRHYDRLHLHTSRGRSGLPFHPMPRRYPRYPSRDQVVEYLEGYAEALGLNPALGVEVTEVRRDVPGWTTSTSAGSIRSDAVVVATGVNGTPFRPDWEDLASFPGPVLHSSDYANGGPFEDGDVLVVGFGNSGGEIALDLVEWRARPTISVRSPVNVVPRDVLGMPLLRVADPLTRLPPAVADLLSWPLLKLHYPSYSRLGLSKARRGPFRQIAESGRIPLLDIGTIREIRRGRIGVAPDVEAIRGPAVAFVDGSERAFDAIVCATGYRPKVPKGLEGLAPGPRGVKSEKAPGLFFCGFYVSPRGMLYEMGIESKRIAAEIAGATRRSRALTRPRPGSTLASPRR